MQLLGWILAHPAPIQADVIIKWARNECSDVTSQMQRHGSDVSKVKISSVVKQPKTVIEIRTPHRLGIKMLSNAAYDVGYLGGMQHVHPLQQLLGCCRSVGHSIQVLAAESYRKFIEHSIPMPKHCSSSTKQY